MGGVTREALGIFDRLAAPVWVLDLEEITTSYANGAALRLWNADSVEALRARQVGSDMSPGMKKRLERYRARFARNESVTEQWTFYPGAGEPVSALCTCSGITLTGQGGERSSMLVEARLDASESSMTSERRLVDAVRHSGECVSLYSLDGQVLLRNPAAEEAFGVGASGDAFSATFLHPGDATTGRMRTAGGGVFEAEVQVKTQSGAGWHQLELREITDPVTGEKALLATQHDVGMRKVYEQRLLQARIEAEELRKRAESASRAKSSFLAVVSHELRTPMTSVLTAAELLRDSELSRDQREWLGMVFQGGQTMVELIDDLLDISRVEAGHVDVRKKPFPIKEHFEAVMLPLKAAARRKGLVLRATVDSGVPDWVTSDARRIGQIVTNLVANAVKFTDRGEVSVALSTATAGSVDGQSLQLRVQDQGIGMDPARLNEVFKPFFQADSTSTRRHGGVGLGLYIVRTLVDALDGRIVVESELGRGSEFLVELPLHLAKAAEDPSVQPRLDASPLTLRVLLADDNQLNRRAFSRLLRRWGCTVSEASDGVEALEEFPRFRPDVVVLDVQMPELDGPGVAKAIRARSDELASVPLLALTADACFADSTDYVEGGFDACLPKPVDWEVFRQALRDLSPDLERTPMLKEEA